MLTHMFQSCFQPCFQPLRGNMFATCCHIILCSDRIGDGFSLIFPCSPNSEVRTMGSSRWISLIGCGMSAFSVSDDLVSFIKTPAPFTFSIRHFPKCCYGPRQDANPKVRQLSLGVPLFKMLLWSTRGSKFPSTSSYVTQCYHQNHTETIRKSIKVGLPLFCRCASIVLFCQNL